MAWIRRGCGAGNLLKNPPPSADHSNMGLGDRRFQQRRRTAQPVELRWQDTALQSVQVTGQIEDVSASGARIFLRRPIRLKSIVTMSYGGRTLEGSVRYCTRKAGGFAVGIEFSAG